MALHSPQRRSLLRPIPKPTSHPDLDPDLARLHPSLLVRLRQLRLPRRRRKIPVRPALPIRRHDRLHAVPLRPRRLGLQERDLWRRGGDQEVLF